MYWKVVHIWKEVIDLRLVFYYTSNLILVTNEWKSELLIEKKLRRYNDLTSNCQWWEWPVSTLHSITCSPKFVSGKTTIQCFLFQGKTNTESDLDSEVTSDKESDEESNKDRREESDERSDKETEGEQDDLIDFLS